MGRLKHTRRGAFWARSDGKREAGTRTGCGNCRAMDKSFRFAVGYGQLAASCPQPNGLGCGSSTPRKQAVAGLADEAESTDGPKHRACRRSRAEVCPASGPSPAAASTRQDGRSPETLFLLRNPDVRDLEPTYDIKREPRHHVLRGRSPRLRARRDGRAGDVSPPRAHDEHGHQPARHGGAHPRARNAGVEPASLVLFTIRT
jgi:hypothetical protein